MSAEERVENLLLYARYKDALLGGWAVNPMDIIDWVWEMQDDGDWGWTPLN